MEQIEKIAQLSASYQAANGKLTEVELRRQTGLGIDVKLLTIMTASIEHAKAVHIALQSKLISQDRVTWSQTLQRLADAERQEEEPEEGGDAVTGTA
jgi:hypothetical protein